MLIEIPEEMLKELNDKFDGNGKKILLTESIKDNKILEQIYNKYKDKLDWEL
jgi:ABC-type Zn uptake system ZnuABC Zn-binding protein ZnuA